MTTTIADNMRMYRARSRLSQAEVASKIGVFEQTIANYEKGKSTPNYETAWQLADLYGCTLDELGGRKH